MSDERQNQTIWSRIIGKAWMDESFKEKLLSDAAATLKAEGMAFPSGAAVRVVENTDQVVHLVVPARPVDLSDEELEMVVGGTGIVHQTNLSSFGTTGTKYTINPK